MTLKTPQEVANDATALMSWGSTDDGIKHAEKIITQDRQAIATALVTALEGMKVCTDVGRSDPAYYHCENTRDGTIDQAKAIVTNLLTPTV